METESVLLVVCGTLVLVILINAGILVALLRSDSSGQLKVFGKAIEAVRDPMGKGNREMKELRQRIAELVRQSEEENTHDD